MPKQVGDKANIPCIDEACRGSMDGTFGGQFIQGESEFMQYLNCKCKVCGVEKVEVFEVFSDRHGYYIVDKISVYDDEMDCSFAWHGFGMPVAEIEDPQAMLNKAANQIKQIVQGCPVGLGGAEF